MPKPVEDPEIKIDDTYNSLSELASRARQSCVLFLARCFAHLARGDFNEVCNLCRMREHRDVT